jgi:uroporphyrin-III C-methyltransferase/precorrin-2 dehydrogenase/sirohydrochlorin ferrochelatase
VTTMLGVSLAGRTVVMVGAGAVTARRLRRFVADGARIRIIAPEAGTEVRALIAEHDVVWIPRRFRAGDLAGAWLVHTATGDARTDARVAALCERRRMLCVNASDGAHGSARLTAEARSGDVVVGVVSDAAVDPSRAARVRDAVAALLDEGRLPIRRRRRTPLGRVDLVGGGPGPVDLLTVRGRRLLAEADVVVADRLGPVDVLRELDPDVEIVDVGKRPGAHTVPQEEINRIIVERAQAGKRVVRLKGGDPFVFGRGGEEVAACLAAGVPVEVVPGLTSVVSVPQSAGIPVTHRGTAATLHVINGQGEIASASSRAALADPAVTTVILMGVAALPRLVAEALAAGAAPEQPVAVIERGHTPSQRTTRSTLGAVVEDARRAAVTNPAVIVVGDVARAGLLLPDRQLAGDALR